MNWTYRKKITIAGSIGAGTGYQVLLKVGESSGALGYNFHVEGKADNFPDDKGRSGDLLFTADDGTTLLPFWTESISGTSPNRVANIWVKVVVNLDTDQDIYCYYGNPDSLNICNGGNTFDLFDDFVSLGYDDLWTKKGSGILNKGYGTLFTAGNGGQGLTTDGTYFYFGKTNGSSVDGTIYKYDFSGNLQISFAGPAHAAGGSYRIDNDSIMFSTGGSETPAVWELTKTGTKLRLWDFTGEGYNQGALIAYKASKRIYLFTSDTSYNFKIQEYQINDNGTWSIVGIEYSHTSLGVPQGLSFVDGYLYYLYDNGISKLQLNTNGSITILETLSDLPGAEKEGLTHWGSSFYYGDSDLDVRIIYNEWIIDISANTTFLTSKESFGKNTAIKLHCRTSNNSLDYPMWGYRSSDSQEYAVIGKLHAANDYLQTRTKTGGNQTESGNIYASQQTWTHYEIARGDSIVKYYVAGDLKYTEFNNVPAGDIPLKLGGVTHSESGNFRVSLVFVRKYIYPEPAFIPSYESGIITCTINHNKIDADLTHFPITLFLNSSNAYNLFQSLSYSLNDDFNGKDGDNPNTKLWRILDGTPAVFNDKLRFEIDNTVHSEAIESKYILHGDFDIQTNFTVINGPSTSIWMFELRVNLVNVNKVLGIARGYGDFGSATAHKYFIDQYDGSSWTYPDSANTSDIVGKLRMVRVGSDFSLFYWDGLSWIQLGSTIMSFGSDDCTINLICNNYVSNPNATLDVDDYIVNSGVEIWRGYGDDAHPNRKKIHLVSNSLTLFCEVEDFQPSLQKAVLHISRSGWIISSSQDTLVNLNYGTENNSDNSNYVGDPGDEVVQNVWNNDFTAVYHLSQDPTGGTDCIKDSTIYSRHGTPLGDMTSDDLVDGQVDRCLAFDGNDDRILIPASLIDNTLFTAFVVFKPNALGGVLVGKGASGESTNTNLLQFKAPYNDHQLSYFYETGAGTNHGYVHTFINSVLDGSFHLGVLCVKDGGHDLWLDTEKQSGVSGNSDSTAPNAFIGDNGSGNGEEWDGLLDEIRIMCITPTDDWVKATYYTLFNELVSIVESPLLNCPPFEKNSTLSLDSFLFTILNNFFQKNSYLFPSDLFLLINLKPLIHQTQLNISFQKRVEFPSFIKESDLYLYNIVEVPENTEVVSSWPFVQNKQINKVDIIPTLPVSFYHSAGLAIPSIIAAGILALPDVSFQKREALNADIIIGIIFPALIKTPLALDVLSIVTMPVGDMFLSVVPFISDKSIAAQLQQIISQGQFTAEHQLSTDIYQGEIISVSNFQTSKSISGMPHLAVILINFNAIKNITVNPQIVLLNPPLISTKQFADITIYNGNFIVSKPFIHTQKLIQNINNYLALPALNSAHILKIPGISSSFILPNFKHVPELIVKKVIVFQVDLANIYYFFTLTGQENGLPDVEIPISSFQASIRNGTPSYLQVVIPGIDYADAISDRPDGTMQIYMAYKLLGQIVRKQLFIEANLETIRLDRGVKNIAITLTGHKTETYTSKDIIIKDVIYESITGPKYKFRFAEPIIDIHPGDNITVGNVTFIADLIVYYVKITKSGIVKTMEVSQ